MKKIFTLIAATVLTVATFAADRRPSVTLKSSKNYEIVIDGKSYMSSTGIMDLSNLRKGQHSIKVYETRRGFGGILGGFGGVMIKGGKKLVDADNFSVTNRDLSINVDFRGQISIQEDRFGHDKWDDRRDNDHHDNRGWK